MVKEPAAKKLNKLKPTKQQKRRGSKSKYQYWISKEGLLLLEGWARDGLTDEQIAKNIGIAPKTLYDWKNKYSELCKTLKNSKAIVDLEVENALLKRAKGYLFDEVKEEYETSEQGSKLIKRTVITKEVVGDTTAQIFWLKNRRPERWQNSDKVIVQQDDQEEVNVHMATLEALKNRKVEGFNSDEPTED
jgi:DNA-binding XRE family transcriptional regulator